VEDIPALVKHFLLQKCSENRTSPVGKELAAETYQVLYRYHWPGNVRELENAVEHLVAMWDQPILFPEHLPEEIRPEPKHQDVLYPIPEGGYTLERVEEELIRKTLEKSGGKIEEAARLLGLTRKILLGKRKKYRMFP
jgi:DNA-binding NtrC family response regulator